MMSPATQAAYYEEIAHLERFQGCTYCEAGRRYEHWQAAAPWPAPHDICGRKIACSAARLETKCTCGGDMREPDTSPERLAAIREGHAMVKPTSLEETTFAIVGDLLAMVDQPLSDNPSVQNAIAQKEWFEQTARDYDANLTRIEVLLDAAKVPKEVCIGTDSVADRVEWALKRLHNLETQVQARKDRDTSRSFYGSHRDDWP